MNAMDVLIILALVLFVPRLVEKLLGKCGFSHDLRIIVMIGGGLWVFGLTYCHELIYSLLNTVDSDAQTYEMWAYDSLESIKALGPLLVALKNSPPGNHFYSGLLAVLLYFGATVTSMLAFNAFMAFWGSLTLTRLIYSVIPERSSRKEILSLFLIFTPSVVFWSSSNLKEGLMYWSICQVYAFVAPWSCRKDEVYRSVMFCIGSWVGSCLRPDFIFLWIVSVVLIKILQVRFFGFIIILLMISLLSLTPINRVYQRVNIENIEKNIREAEGKLYTLIDRGKASTFDYGETGPILILSGLKNTLFRPFLWNVRNVRAVFTGLEIWTISIGIMFLWFRMSKLELKHILRNPAIWSALIVCIPFFFLMTFFPNEGLIARERVQLFPALLALFAIPIVQRNKGVEGTPAEKRDGTTVNPSGIFRSTPLRCSSK